MNNNYPKSIHWELDTSTIYGCAGYEITDGFHYLHLKHKYLNDWIIIYGGEGEYQFADTPWGDLDVKKLCLRSDFKKSDFNCGIGELRELTPEELILEPPKMEVDIEFY